MYPTFLRLLFASVIMATIGGGILYTTERRNGIYFNPADTVQTIGTSFSTEIRVHTDTPVNVFSGDISFDPEMIEVVSIDYNTSIADLWAEEPWYHNGEGTLNFGGGTTKAGGFVGNDILLTITFATKALGSSTLTLTNARLLQHDGMGTDLLINPKPVDAILSIEPVQLEEKTKVLTPKQTSRVVVASSTQQVAQPQSPLADMNKDGIISLIDVSIFFQQFIAPKPGSPAP